MGELERKRSFPFPIAGRPGKFTREPGEGWGNEQAFDAGQFLDSIKDFLVDARKEKTGISHSRKCIDS